MSERGRARGRASSRTYRQSEERHRAARALRVTHSSAASIEWYPIRFSGYRVQYKQVGPLEEEEGRLCGRESEVDGAGGEEQNEWWRVGGRYGNQPMRCSCRSRSALESMGAIAMSK